MRVKGEALEKLGEGFIADIQRLGGAEQIFVKDSGFYMFFMVVW